MSRPKPINATRLAKAYLKKHSLVFLEHDVVALAGLLGAAQDNGRSMERWYCIKSIKAGAADLRRDAKSADAEIRQWEKDDVRKQGYSDMRGRESMLHGEAETWDIVREHLESLPPEVTQ